MSKLIIALPSVAVIAAMLAGLWWRMSRVQEAHRLIEAQRKEIEALKATVADLQSLVCDPIISMDLRNRYARKQRELGRTA